MLLVKNTQLDKLQKNVHDDFAFRMVASISQNFSLDKNNAQLKQEVAIVIAEAENFGFETEETIEQYLYLKWKFDGFRKLPLRKEILSILTFPDRTPEVKIDELIFYFKKSG